MKAISFKSCIASISLLILCSFATAAQTQSNGSPNQIRIIHYNGDFQNFLGHIAKSMDVTIGLELDIREPVSNISLELEYPTIADVLNTIVTRKPNYVWRNDGGFITVYPRDLRTSVLDISITSFNVKDATSDEALNQLLNLPETRAALKGFDLQAAPATQRDTPAGNKLSIDMAQTSLRQALNRIAAASGGRYWVFQRSGSRGSILIY